MMIQPLWEKMASELRELEYTGLIQLSGFGECLLHPRLVDIVKAFDFANVSMNTNGELLTRDKVHALYEAGLKKMFVSVYTKERIEPLKELTRGYENLVVIRPRYENWDKLFNNRAGAVAYYGEEHTDGLCYYPFYMMMVDCNGDVFPCCHEWQRRLKLGNLYQHTIWETWISDAYKRVRTKILEGKRDLYPCRICNVNGKLRGRSNYDGYVKLLEKG
jgi:radical SAM protein with 4Fe4S-binding SPASM domain